MRAFLIMAERFNKEHDERTRKKIQVSQIINRLTKHIDGECEMAATQIRAAEILLKKALPDLSSIQHSGDPDNPLDMKWVIEVKSAKDNNS